MRAAEFLLRSIAVILIIPLSQCQSSKLQRISGEYVGLERMESLSPEDPLTLWYHENTLFIRNGEFVLDQAPVSIRKGKKTYSASDGGFLVYRGKILSTNNRTFAAMRLFSSDYVMFRSGPKECEPYSRITVVPIIIKGTTIQMNGVQYRAESVKDEYKSIWTKELADESLQYNGKHYIDPHAPACPVPPELTSR